MTQLAKWRSSGEQVEDKVEDKVKGLSGGQRWQVEDKWRTNVAKGMTSGRQVKDKWGTKWRTSRGQWWLSRGQVKHIGSQVEDTWRKNWRIINRPGVGWAVL